MTKLVQVSDAHIRLCQCASIMRLCSAIHYYRCCGPCIQRCRRPCPAPIPRFDAVCRSARCRTTSGRGATHDHRSEEHTSELQSLMRLSYAVFCLKKNKHLKTTTLI